MDYDLMQGYNAENIKLLHRPSASHPWQVVHATRSGSPYSGYLTTDFLAPGQYCLAVGDPSASISEYLSEKELHIYPNPADDMLNILINEPSKNMKASILDSTGKIVKSIKLKSGENSINIHNLPSGTYIIRAMDGSGTWSKRFVKK